MIFRSGGFIIWLLEKRPGFECRSKRMIRRGSDNTPHISHLHTASHYPNTSFVMPLIIHERVILDE
jgi:hypothetical protein